MTKEEIVMENGKLPTAEAILLLNLTELQLDNASTPTLKNCLKAMNEHTRLHTAPLLERIRELENTPSNAQVILAEGYNRINSENERLREALELVVSSLTKVSKQISRGVVDSSMIRDANNIAKEALKPKES